MDCPAKDTPSEEPLRVRPVIFAQLISWLRWHDRESGDLYGILPFIVGKLVAMSDHIDRSVDKHISRGRVGCIISWILASKEHTSFEDGSRMLQLLPNVVFVDFLVKHGNSLP